MRLTCWIMYDEDLWRYLPSLVAVVRLELLEIVLISTIWGAGKPVAKATNAPVVCGVLMCRARRSILRVWLKSLPKQWKSAVEAG